MITIANKARALTLVYRIKGERQKREDRGRRPGEKAGKAGKPGKRIGGPNFYA